MVLKFIYFISSFLNDIKANVNISLYPSIYNVFLYVIYILKRPICLSGDYDTLCRVYRKVSKTREGVKRDLVDYIKTCCNGKRHHSYLDYLVQGNKKNGGFEKSRFEKFFSTASSQGICIECG